MGLLSGITGNASRLDPARATREYERLLGQGEQIHAAYSMGATRFQVIVHVILRAAIPEILTGMRIGIGVGWTTLVAGEMVAATRGLGYMVLSASEFLASDVVIMGIIVIGFFAFLFDLMMRYLERTLVPWKGKV